MGHAVSVLAPYLEGRVPVGDQDRQMEGHEVSLLLQSSSQVAGALDDLFTLHGWI